MRDELLKGQQEHEIKVAHVTVLLGVGTRMSESIPGSDLVVSNMKNGFVRSGGGQKQN
jgi:hypothetical protein